MEALNKGLEEFKSNPGSGLLKDRLKKNLIVLYDLLEEDVEEKVEKKIESKSVVMEMKETLVDQLTSPINHFREEVLEEQEEEEAEVEVEDAMEELLSEEDNSFDLFGEILFGEEEEDEIVLEEQEEEKYEEITTFKLNQPMAHSEEEETVEIPKEEEETVEEELSFVDKVREPHTDKLEEFKNMPIESLATTIPIGKKFEFIEDLFIGNSDEYSKAIKEIDGMPDFKNAEEYLMLNYFDKFGWMEKEKVLNNLFDFVNRRFAA